MRYAVINSANTVANVIDAPEGWTVADHTVIASDTASKGDIWDGSGFSTPVVSPILGLKEQYTALTNNTERISLMAQNLGFEDKT
tara:strand:- start:2676 stop:2930 length:255 start_codon:yes stop_codon:yes gene_type:complete